MPSMVAAAVVCLANLTLSCEDTWVRSTHKPLHWLLPVSGTTERRIVRMSVVHLLDRRVWIINLLLRCTSQHFSISLRQVYWIAALS